MSEGTLLLNKQDIAGRQFQPNATGTGAIFVGNDGGGNDADILRYGSSAGVDQISALSNLFITSSALVDLANRSDFVNA